MNVINIAGDWILIFGNLGAPVMGTDGSAIASVIAFSVGALLYYGLWRSDRLVISWGTGLKGFSMPITRRILKIGSPTAVEQLAFDVGLFVFLRMVSQFGTEAVSAYMIGVRILGFSFIPGLGFSMAASTLVGQYLGARQPEEAARAGWRAVGGAMGIMTALGLLIIMLATPISDWFGAAGSNTTRLTVVFIYILGACQPLMAIEFAVGGGLRGAGDTRFPLFSMMVGILGFRLGVGWWVTTVMDGGVVALWTCLIGDYALRAGLLATRFWWGRWKTIRI
jgi:putative MATE family efflux protein